MKTQTTYSMLVVSQGLKCSKHFLSEGFIKDESSRLTYQRWHQSWSVSRVPFTAIKQHVWWMNAPPGPPANQVVATSTFSLKVPAPDLSINWVVSDSHLCHCFKVCELVFFMFQSIKYQSSTDKHWSLIKLIVFWFSAIMCASIHWIL